MKGKETLTDIYYVLEEISHTLDRIANVVEMNHQRALEREAMEAEERARGLTPAEERELAEAEERYPGITAEVGPDFRPPF